MAFHCLQFFYLEGGTIGISNKRTDKRESVMDEKDFEKVIKLFFKYNGGGREMNCKKDGVFKPHLCSGTDWHQIYFDPKRWDRISFMLERPKTYFLKKGGGSV